MDHFKGTLDPLISLGPKWHLGLVAERQAGLQEFPRSARSSHLIGLLAPRIWAVTCKKGDLESWVWQHGGVYRRVIRSIGYLAFCPLLSQYQNDPLLDPFWAVLNSPVSASSRPDTDIPSSRM